MLKGYRGKSRASATCARARTRAALLARSLSVRFARCSKWKVTSAMNSFPLACDRRTNICFKFIWIYCCLFWQLFKGGLSEISVQAGGRLQGFRIWRNGQRRSWFRYTSQGTVNSLHFICSFFLSSLAGEERDFARGSSPKKKRLIVGYNRRSVI